MKIQIIVVKLLFMGALFIISNQNLHLAIVSEREIFFNAYGSWITGVFQQIVQLTGYVIRFDWLPR